MKMQDMRIEATSPEFEADLGASGSSDPFTRGGGGAQSSTEVGMYLEGVSTYPWILPDAPPQ